MVRYLESQPRMELRPWVRCVWSYEDEMPSGVVQRIPPDGCPELVLHLAQPYEEEVDGRFSGQPRAIFAGQMTRPLCLRAAGPVACAGLRFHPDGASAWFGAPLIEATDLRLDATDRLGASRASNTEEAIELLQDAATIALLASQWPLDREVREDIERLRHADSESEPDASRDPANLDLASLDPAARRRIQRRYLKLVGVSQQMLQSIFRFRRVFDRAAEQDGGNWLAVALDAGYFDQPQMARDFRRFLGCTATEWAREQIELGRAVASYPSA